MPKIKFIDLFAGAGGLSEGFVKAGFTPVAHVEMNKDACDTLRTRTAFHWLKEKGREEEYYDYLKGTITRDELWNKIPDHLIKSVINKEISEDTLPIIFEQIDAELGTKKVDLVIGGPPCQAYSVAGRVRKDMTNDPRNHLYKHYVEFLKKYQPKMFVFENVPGILSAKNGEYLQLIFDAVREAGYKLDKQVLNARDFGVLQDRKRVIIIGWRNDLNLEYPQFKRMEMQFQIAKHLFSDLPKIKSGQGNWGVSKYTKRTNEYLEFSGIRKEIDFTTQHISRFNNENDLEIYRIAVDKWVNKGKRLNYGELPERLIKHNNVKTFTNRFQVVNHEGVSHTVVAHICADGHYYIHPDIHQNRSITVREAARIQSFPDDYFFESSRTAAFKQIGNAVPVLMGEGIAKKIKKLLK
ncbi:DNA (cytosine-5)-methyltransferase 1 [Chryseobacterium piscicola]|uniref:Cytosine-specific methyltransferase n=1 Tax=Chryseobacterium piscicola TaxID=551459 RepID=A0A1N7N888_9FLAO|nr:DNA (cytosine-5-)-methyltransferase [Chryseobacterium piscicola]PQA90183.1 DNA (cytosine-5-)-methyltransferase [Chryseobacterium piscicola]SIS94574.1 DNA (cytosine-5)-methyltransferase 1 [Chryseobacterium piscicola]